MEIKENLKEKIKKELMDKYKEEGFDYGEPSLGSIIIDDFVYDTIDEYDGKSSLISICSAITGLDNGSYTCSTYKSAQLTAEHIFEFNDIAQEMEEDVGTILQVTNTDLNLVNVLLYICELTILNYDCETLGELIEKLL